MCGVGWGGREKILSLSDTLLWQLTQGRLDNLNFVYAYWALHKPTDVGKWFRCIAAKWALWFPEVLQPCFISVFEGHTNVFVGPLILGFVCRQSFIILAHLWWKCLWGGVPHWLGWLFGQFMWSTGVHLLRKHMLIQATWFGKDSLDSYWGELWLLQ